MKYLEKFGTDLQKNDYRNLWLQTDRHNRILFATHFTKLIIKNLKKEIVSEGKTNFYKEALKNIFG